MDLKNIRNFGIAAHIDAGKTTVTERFLFYSGKEHQMGEVHDGNATMDWMEEERERGITITAAATQFLWNEYIFNLIDTPGHVDFTAEVERSMRVLDGVIIVFCGVAGVEAQSETVWRQADKYHVPRICFVNKLDRTGADWERALAGIRSRLKANAVALQLPLGREREFSGVVDLIAEQAWTWDDELGRHPRAAAVPSEAAAAARGARAALIEQLADLDDGLMVAYLEGAEIGPDRIRAVVRRETLAGRLTPVFFGAALRNRGIQPLMDAVGYYLPSPLDVPPVEGLVEARGRKAEGGLERAARPPDPAGPLAALVFKVFTDRHGELCYTRIYSGTLAQGDQVYNSRTGKVERIGRILRMHAGEGAPVKSAGPGEIVALPGLRFAATGDTLYSRGDPISLEPIRFPEPVMSMAIEPASSADRDRLLEALGRLQREDPTFQMRSDEETGQQLISGMGELHLEIIRHRLERDFSVQGRVGRPRVSYRETVSRPAQAEELFDRMLGGKPLFARVRLTVAPGRTEGKPVFSVRCAPEEVPREFHEPIRQAVLGTAEGGLSFGYPLVAVDVALVGGEWREGLSSEAAFQAAASAAFRKAVEAGGETLLEPIMRFEVQAPAEATSALISDLNTRRAQISEMVMGQEPCLIRGEVPLSAMFGYSTMVRSLSQGRATFSMEPARYAPVPAELLESLFPGWS